MSMRLLVDVNLSPEWITELDRHGYRAVHWSTVGDRPRPTPRSWPGRGSMGTLFSRMI